MAAEQERIVWKAVGGEPIEQDLEVAVIDQDGAHPLVCPCRRIADGWVVAATRRRIDIRPTHWRPWQAEEHSPPQ